jgi:hypothetical protein
MAHYALLNYQNIVTKICTGKNENETDANIELVYQNMFGQLCKRTSYNTRGGVHYDPVTNEPSEDQSKAFRKNYAGIGYTYDETRDAFIPPQPFDSWMLNETSCLWEAPVAYPDDDQMYTWNEETTSWDLITE